MGKITTVLGDISPEELGYTTIHEHPFMRADSDGVPVSYTHLTLPTILRV